MSVEVRAEVAALGTDRVTGYQTVKDPEATLVAAAKRGDLKAFDELVIRHQRKIFRVAQRITKNREDAEDVIQESFLNAFIHLSGFNGDSRFNTWLTRIAINESLMKLRRRQRFQEVPFEEPDETGSRSFHVEVTDLDPGPEQRCSQQQQKLLLNEVVGRLSPALQSVIRLREMEDLSVEETAQVLGLSTSAVKSRAHRARRKLHCALNDYSCRPRNRRSRKKQPQRGCNEGPGVVFGDHGETETQPTIDAHLTSHTTAPEPVPHRVSLHLPGQDSPP